MVRFKERCMNERMGARKKLLMHTDEPKLLF